MIYPSLKMIIDCVYDVWIFFPFRSRLSIIPQDPFLFDDTVSKNLDPRDEYTDEMKCDALKKCHLYQAVQNMGSLFVIDT